MTLSQKMETLKQTKKKEETRTLVTIHDLGYVKVLHPVQLRNFP